MLTLPAYGFYWFHLTAAPAAESRFGPRLAPELFTLVLTGGLDSVLEGRERAAFERTVAPRFVAGQRWFAGKGAGIASVRLLDHATLKDRFGRDAFLLPRVAVQLRGGGAQHYFLPIAGEEGRDEIEPLLAHAVARVRRGPRVGLLYDAVSAPEFAHAVVAALRADAMLATSEGGGIRFAPTRRLAEEPSDGDEVRRLGAEQSNSSIVIADRQVLKVYRRLQPGIHPEVEIGRFLTDVAHFANTPPLLGAVEHVSPDGTPTALAVLQGFVRNQGDGWRFTLETLRREFETMALVPEAERPSLEEAFGIYLQYAVIVGARTAELHRAFATPTDDPAFAAEPFGPDDLASIAEDARAQARRAFAALERLAPAASDTAQEAIGRLLMRRADCLDLISRLRQGAVQAVKTRVHGDYHLGQVLIVQDDVFIVDFEGEPSRPADERRIKSSPLRDVAGMLRSFAYAAATGAREVGQRFPEAAPQIAVAASHWEALARDRFLAAYADGIGDAPSWPAEEAARTRLLRLYLLAKALYEINYEADNRPDWIETPVRGVLSILDQDGGSP
jgi:maltose alpha-D-glucosyltransferase/alpha-amylase